MSNIHKLTPDNPPQLPCSIFLPSSGWNYFEVCALGAADYLKIGYTHWCKSRTPAATPTPEELLALEDMLPSEIAVRLGQLLEGYPASEQHTKCSLLITQLRQELERYEESRPMSEHEQKMITAGLDHLLLAATPTPAASEDGKELIEWADQERLGITWSDRADAFIVQSKDQVVGNIGKGRTILEALRAAQSKARNENGGGR